MTSPGGSAGNESACNVGDLGLLPGLGRSPGEGNGYPFQYSGIENSMDCIVHGVAKSRTLLSDFHILEWLVSHPGLCFPAFWTLQCTHSVAFFQHLFFFFNWECPMSYSGFNWECPVSYVWVLIGMSSVLSWPSQKGIASQPGLKQYWTQDSWKNNQKGHQQDSSLWGCLWMKEQNIQCVIMV